MNGKTKQILLPVLTSVLFAGSFIGGKYTTADLGPLTASLLRYIAALVCLGVLGLQQRRSSSKIERGDWYKLVLLGIFGIVGYHFFFFSALRHTAIANTAIINALIPIVTAAMAAIFINERLRPINYAGIAVAVCGVIVLLVKGDIHNLIGLRINLGDGFMLMAVANWVVYALLVKKLSEKYSSFTITFYATLFGTFLLAVLAFTENFIGQIREISAASFWSIIYMGVGVSGIGYLLFNLSVAKIGPTRTAGVVYSLVPVFVAILALLFFAEAITFVMIASGGLILIGLRLMMQSGSSSE